MFSVYLSLPIVILRYHQKGQMVTCMKSQKAFICPVFYASGAIGKMKLVLMLEPLKQLLQKVLFLSICFSTVDVIRICELNWDPAFSCVLQWFSLQIPFFSPFTYSHWSKLPVNVNLMFIPLLMTCRFTVKLWQDYCLYSFLTFINEIFV